MNSIQTAEKGELLYPDGSSAVSAIIEVVVACLAFITLAHLLAANSDLESIMPSFLLGPERQVGATFFGGAIAQIGLVMIFSVISIDLRRAISNSFRSAGAPSWAIAGIAVSIHAVTISFFFLDNPGQILEPSSTNLFLSIAPVVDGWSQEVFFRGYVIYRLARGGIPVPAIFAISALAFASIHIGYIGADFSSIFWPMFGTTVLGLFFTWSVFMAQGALLQVVICHAALIAVIQPWLALA